MKTLDQILEEFDETFPRAGYLKSQEDGLKLASVTMKAFIRQAITDAVVGEYESRTNALWRSLRDTRIEELKKML